MTEKKLALVKKLFVNETLKDNYYFLTNCTSKILKGIAFQPIIKPGTQGFPKIISALAVIEIDNNYLSEPSLEFINVEITKHNIDSLINGLTQLKENLDKIEGNINDKIENKP